MNKLDTALNRYYEKFGKNYPLCICGNRASEEIIADIELCIDTETEAQEPVYEYEDADY